MVRDARLDVRLPKAAKERIETAAALSCQTLAEFTSSVLLREAEQVIERNRIIHLSEEHWTKFMEALDNPPQPTEHARRVAAEYVRTARQEGDVIYFAAGAFSDPDFTEGGDPH